MSKEKGDVLYIGLIYSTRFYMNISEEVISGLKKIAKNKDVTMDSTIKELGLDSLDVVDVLLEMEEKYNIEFSNEEMLSFKYVKDIVEAISKKMN